MVSSSSDLAAAQDVALGSDVEDGRNELCSVPSSMGSLDERIAYIEGRMEDHAALFADIRAEMREMRGEMSAFRTDVTAELRSFRTEMDRRFTWTISLLVGVLMAMVGVVFQIARWQSL